MHREDKQYIYVWYSNEKVPQEVAGFVLNIMHIQGIQGNHKRNFQDAYGSPIFAPGFRVSVQVITCTISSFQIYRKMALISAHSFQVSTNKQEINFRRKKNYSCKKIRGLFNKELIQFFFLLTQFIAHKFILLHCQLNV